MSRERKTPTAWQPAQGAEHGSLQRRVAHGLTWTLLESWGAPLLGLLIFVVLARLLTEADFGLVALATVFMFLVHSIVDQGLGDALIQRTELTTRAVNTCFWITVGTSVAFTVAGVALAEPIATLLGEPELAPILLALATTFVLAGLSSTQMALLRRQLAFRELALRRLVAVVVAGVIAVALAFSGAGAWALVGQQVASAVVSIFVLWTVSPWRPAWEFSLVDFRELFGFSRNVVAGEVLHFLSRNSDNLLIGAFLGTVALGLYAIAYKVLDITQQLLVNAAMKLAFPVFARLQDQADTMRRAYLRATGAVALLTLPGYVGLAIVAHEAIVVVFGPRWAPSATPATILFLLGPALTVQIFSGALLNAVGHPGVTLRFRFISTVTNVIGFAIAVAFFGNITAVAAAFVLRSYLLMPLLLFWVRRYAHISLTALAMTLRAPALATVVMAGAVLAVKLVLLPRVGPGLLLTLEMLTGMAVFGACMLVLDRERLREVATFFVQGLPRGDRLGRAARLAVPSARRPQPPAAGLEPVRDVDLGTDAPRAADA